MYNYHLLYNACTKSAWNTLAHSYTSVSHDRTECLYIESHRYRYGISVISLYAFTLNSAMYNT